MGSGLGVGGHGGQSTGAVMWVSIGTGPCGDMGMLGLVGAGRGVAVSMGLDCVVRVA